MITYIGIVLQYINMVFLAFRSCKRYLTNPEPPMTEQLFSFDNTPLFDDTTHVPEGCVYVQTWTIEGVKKSWVLYEGDEIAILGNPCEQKAYVPWVWIGDVETEYDLTEKLTPFLVPGNRIRYALLSHFKGYEEEMKIQYIDRKTLDFVDFQDGLLIEANE